MSQFFGPRLSEAKLFLPFLRRHLISAASHFPLRNGLGLELLPIGEDGLFGYELVPDREMHTYVTIGRNALGEPVMRKTMYGLAASTALRLVAVDGHLLSRRERAARYRTEQREARFADWNTAVEAGWAQLLLLFPERPRRPVVLPEGVHRCLEEALSVAHAHLALWNPFIQFCGVPNEAQHGFVLAGAHGERGELVFQRPDIWMLRWKAPPYAVYESWSVAAPALDAPSNLAGGDRAS